MDLVNFARSALVVSVSCTVTTASVAQWFTAPSFARETRVRTTREANLPLFLLLFRAGHRGPSVSVPVAAAHSASPWPACHSVQLVFLRWEKFQDISCFPEIPEKGVIFYKSYLLNC